MPLHMQSRDNNRTYLMGCYKDEMVCCSYTWSIAWNKSLCCFEVATFLSLCAGFRHLAPHKYTYTKACYCCENLGWKLFQWRPGTHPPSLPFDGMPLPTIETLPLAYPLLTSQSHDFSSLSSRSGMERMFEVFSSTFHICGKSMIECMFCGK